MKAEWKETTFGKCATLGRETTMPSSDATTTPYIGLEHIEAETLRLNGHGWANEVTSQKLKFNSGDVLFGKLRPYFRKVVRPKFSGVCSTDIWVLRAHEGVDQGFLFYLVAQPEFSESATQNSGGTRMPRADWNHTANRKLQLPPLAEQRAIARILSSLDDKIELNRRMNATLEALAQTLFRAWFVDFEPVKARTVGLQPAAMDAQTAALFPSEFEASTCGPIPKGWKVQSLDNIATFLNGLALQKHRPATEEEGLPVIKIAQLRSGSANGDEKASSSIGPAYIVEDGDVLFSWSGSLEVTVWCGGRGALNQHLFKVSSAQFPKWFYLLWTLKHLSHFREIAADKATTMGHIQRKHLTEAKVLVPDEKLLKRMTAILQPLLDRQINNRLESRTLADIRDSLLPRLISGQLRVPDAAQVLASSHAHAAQ